MPLPAQFRELLARIRRRRGAGNSRRTLISVHRERVVVLASMLAVLLLGLPLWWTTTRVYRAHLPADAIAALTPTQPLVIPLVFYIDSQNKVPDSMLADVERTAAKIAARARRPHAKRAWPVELRADVRRGVAPDTPGHYTLRVRTAPGADASVDIDAGRAATVAVPAGASVAPVLSELISDIVVGEEHAVGRGALAQTADRALKYSPEYAVTLSLLNEDPSGGALFDWDIEAAVDSYLAPFVSALRPLATLAVTSQVLHHAGAPPLSQLHTANRTQLDRDVLARFVNSPSWNLASTDPVSPMLNFLMYVPSQDSQPMQIAHPDASHTNAFLLAQWGGVAIANLNFTADPGTRQVLSREQLRPYMGVFIAQLRTLLGIRRHTPLPPSHSGTGALKDVRVRLATNTGISGWELDALARQWLIDARQTAITTLQSLIRLVDSLQNMVVTDEIKSKLDGSLAELDAIAESLASDHILACSHATRASTLAESAFFDPSMVSMLYFPDQHKYAIYLPFFLPVALPLLTAVKRVLKNYKQSRQSNATPSSKPKNE
ncbi:GPI transamidase component [Coemansia sp. Benny D115]|nr:GPI transamidase component [Coemansia sp. Benny D115]